MADQVRADDPSAADNTQRSAMPLMSVDEGQEVEFVSVRAGRSLQHRLAEIGLRPGVRFEVISRGRPGPFIICLKGARLVLGQEMVCRVNVRPV